MGSLAGKHPLAVAGAIVSGSLLAAALIWWHFRRRWHDRQREIAATLLPSPGDAPAARAGLPASSESRLEAGAVETFEDNCINNASFNSLAGAVATSTRIPPSKDGTSFSKGTELSTAESGAHMGGDREFTFGTSSNGPSLPNTKAETNIVTPLADMPPDAATADGPGRSCAATADDTSSAAAAEPAAAAAAAAVAEAPPTITVPPERAKATSKPPAAPASAGSHEEAQVTSTSSYAMHSDDGREEVAEPVPVDDEIPYRRKSTLEFRYEALDNFPKTRDATSPTSGAPLDLPERFSVAVGETTPQDDASSRNVEHVYEALDSDASRETRDAKASQALGQVPEEDLQALKRAAAAPEEGCNVSTSPNDAKTS
mmetsp:Transcript_98699/g.190588  ORF Transcript_98699/g.190588 Transcript_98699/m.190588 type:complete len:372 (+) Transcript_98699:102-1217(+)